MIAYRLEASYRDVGFTPIDLQFWERDRIAETARDIVAGRGQRERQLDFHQFTSGSCEMPLTALPSRSRYARTGIWNIIGMPDAEL